MSQDVKVTVRNGNRVSVRQSGIGQDQVSARTVGIPGKQGDIGEQGEVGLSWRGAYIHTATYRTRDAVSFAGSSYVYSYESPANGIVPTNTTYWDIIAGGNESGDKTYVHIQNVAATVWTVPHNMGKFPSVSVVDSGNTEVEGDVIFIDVNTIELRFSSAFGGKAYFN